MLAVVQFPIADGRLFCGIDRQPKPVWGSLSEGMDFVPRFGGARVQTDFDAVPKRWRDDAQYVSARWAIRARGRLERRDFAGTDIAPPPRDQPFWVYRSPNPASPFCFAPAFRRLLSDGIGASRVDLGFWVFGEGTVGGTDVLRLVGDLLEIETEVTDLDGVVERRALGRQGNPLASLYFHSTSPRPRDPLVWPQRPATVRAGACAVFIDDRMGVPQMPPKPPWFRAMAAHLRTPLLERFPSKASIVPETVTGGLRLAYTTLELGSARHAVWMIRGTDGQAAGEAIPGLRQCLLRLHSMRQCLHELQRLAATGLIPCEAEAGESDGFASYIGDIASQVLQSKRFGVNQAELHTIVSLYDLGEGGLERDRLELAYGRLPLDRQLKSRTLKATRLAAGNVTYYRMEVNVTNTNVTNTGPTISIDQSGSGTISIHELNQVAGDYIRHSGELAAASPDEALRAALDDLRKQIEALAHQIPDPKDQEAAARKLKQLTEEATSGNPDPDTVKVTSEGLIKAAKTVAEMVGPVTTAVKGVLALLGLAL